VTSFITVKIMTPVLWKVQYPGLCTTGKQHLRNSVVVILWLWHLHI